MQDQRSPHLDACQSAAQRVGDRLVPDRAAKYAADHVGRARQDQAREAEAQARREARVAGAAARRDHQPRQSLSRGRLCAHFDGPRQHGGRRRGRASGDPRAAPPRRPRRVARPDLRVQRAGIASSCCGGSTPGCTGAVSRTCSTSARADRRGRAGAGRSEADELAAGGPPGARRGRVSAMRSTSAAGGVPDPRRRDRRRPRRNFWGSWRCLCERPRAAMMGR